MCIPVKTISVRDLRGESLAADAREGLLVGITNYRVLIGVVVPVTPAWVEHLIDYNWSRVKQSIDESEQEAVADTPAVTLDGLLVDARDDPELVGQEGRRAGDAPLRLLAAAISAVGALAGHAGLSGVAEQLYTKVIHPLQAAVTVPGSAVSGAEDQPSVRNVRIGDLSAGLIEEASRDGQTLALTHDRVLVGIVIPVTPSLVQFLIEQNFSRVLHNITVGEKENIYERFVTLDEVTLDEEVMESPA
jgi:hypothetical protein